MESGALRVERKSIGSSLRSREGRRCPIRSGMTGRGCHPVMLLYRISLFPLFPS
ncbi:MAG: hypothetical protein WAZ22_01495 [Mesotoga infera]